VRHESRANHSRLLLAICRQSWSDAVRLVLHWFSGRSLVREALVLCMLCATLMAALPEEFRSLPATRTAVTWVRFARLEPRYQLFVPSVSRDDGWFVTNGELVDGTKIEVWPQELTSGRGWRGSWQRALSGTAAMSAAARRTLCRARRCSASPSLCRSSLVA
jgi:hypothetical protein